MSPPRISVVIPSYNHEAYLGAAVDSVLDPPGPELELIVVDDGSTDGSREVLAGYADDPRVRLELQPNRGAHAALNRGLELVRGELVLILDSDDLYVPGRIATLAERLEGMPDAALGASWLEVVDRDDRPLGVKRAWRTLPPWPAPVAGPTLAELGDPRLALLETNWIATTSNLAFPAALVRDHGLRFAPLRYAHDWDFILSACHHGRVALIEEPLLRYRVHGANTIDEGDGAGRGPMRFEIMWVVARHAERLLRASADHRHPLDELRRRLSRSAPSFGCDAIFDQLLLLRGGDDRPPAAYDALLDPDHPFRRSAIEVLETG